MLISFDFVGHLCWKGQFCRFDSLASAWVCLWKLVVHFLIFNLLNFCLHMWIHTKKNLINLNITNWHK
jgi:hypothetical protein